ncbi:MAG: AI-2E family transporter [Proteobacteria bacterium]|nr:AI-2E family transporter [Pseudomonadota bacterium]MBU1139216.1 AI-2E family transporter [Pseudomonadota bacterium]MBU1233953.1 AI-2E family transporter [Pseudomonadota bacterium]MBU1420774.1 AI-2E family transporter [Pseudomonadota bacterium]MBU1456878.1 AI-2E family transporter [Pseudomonadota bacterium]
MRIWYFLLVFLVSIIFLGRILWPFWSILVLSFLLTSLFRPVYSVLVRKMPVNLASILTCLLIILIVFIPLFFFVGALSNEALGLYHWGRDTQVGLKFQFFIQNSPLIAQLQVYLDEFGFRFEPAQLTGALSYLAKMAGLFFYNQASSWAANILQFLFLFFMMILTIFFLLIDQERLINFIIDLSPLPDDEDRLLLEKFEEIANAILKGNGICGIIQGVLGGVVFSILGLNSPILWGGIMAILAFLPIFGIGLVMIPAAIILMLNDSVGSGVFLFFFYLVLSFTIEYLVKPKMVGNQVHMHTLLVFLAILGGLSVYGLLGIIYGPLIITAFLTLTDIYLAKYDYYVQRM